MGQTLSQYSQGAMGARRTPLTQPEEFLKEGPLELDSEGQAGEACQEKTARKSAPRGKQSLSCPPRLGPEVLRAREQEGGQAGPSEGHGAASWPQQHLALLCRLLHGPPVTLLSHSLLCLLCWSVSQLSLLRVLGPLSTRSPDDPRLVAVKTSQMPTTPEVSPARLPT